MIVELTLVEVVAVVVTGSAIANNDHSIVMTWNFQSV